MYQKDVNVKTYSPMWTWLCYPMATTFMEPNGPTKHTSQKTWDQQLHRIEKVITN